MPTCIVGSLGSETPGARASAPPDDTTSSIVYLMMMVSATRYPLLGFSSTLRLTNLRYPWQLRALGSCGRAATA